MKKNSKKALATTMCTVMMLGAVAPIVSAKAEDTIHYPYENVSNTSTQIKYDVDISSALKTDTSIQTKYENGIEVVDGNQTVHGKWVANVNSDALFEEASNLYTDSIDRDYGTKVMFSKDKKFPSFTYTITFPEGVNIDESNIKMSDNTFTVSKIEKSVNGQVVTFTFNLGNWNDYRTFFTEYRKEKDDSILQFINLEIPYTFDVYDGTPIADINKNISSNGKCELWYYKDFVIFKIEKVVVDITVKNAELPLIATSSNIE